LGAAEVQLDAIPDDAAKTAFHHPHLPAADEIKCSVDHRRTLSTDVIAVTGMRVVRSPRLMVGTLPLWISLRAVFM
jgi:hypothetical protein